MSTSVAHDKRSAGPDLTADVLRGAFALFPSGVTAVCGIVDGQPVGLAASSFTSVSLGPPLVSVCVAHTSTTWPVLRRSRTLGVSVLAHDHGPVARQLAAKGVERFRDIAWEQTESGAVLLSAAALWLECSIAREVAAGDHDIVLLHVAAAMPYPDVTPMVFHGSKFRRLAS
jgi:flavin reductase (DIM6/NTAB) family NADH-FMN oxidoreductase RutF